MFSLKLSIMHKNGPAVYTKCSHGLFSAARYNYTTPLETPPKLLLLPSKGFIYVCGLEEKYFIKSTKTIDIIVGKL